MFGTWDSHRSRTAWPSGGRNAQDPHSKFVTTVDRLFYVAAAAFAVSIIALLVG